jgi:hypothetical protein
MIQTIITDDIILNNFYHDIYNNYNTLINNQIEEILDQNNYLTDKINEIFEDYNKVEKNSIFLAYLAYIKYLFLF